MSQQLTVLFDLDGTIADTEPDLTAALNQTLRQHQQTELESQQVRPVISAGSVAMLKLGFDMHEQSPEFKQIRSEFLDIYARRAHNDSRLFPGIAELLDELDAREQPFGIITNKMHNLTVPLIEKLKLKNRIACLVCGDTASHPKPHPAPLLFACDKLGISSAQAVYIGDARNDVLAARAADMQCLVAGYGYIPESENLTSWRADYIANSPADISRWLSSQA